MAPQNQDRTSRKRKRKARTEVSSASESSSESEKATTPPRRTQPQSDGHAESSSALINKDEKALDSPQPTSHQERRPKDSEQAFEDFYLKQATKEFANDIDKLRSAPDFNERHVPVLIRALRQGSACFTKEERLRIGGAAS